MINCPKELNQFLLGEPLFENTFSDEECEMKKFYGDCYHCFATAIAKRDKLLKPKGKWIHWTDDYKDYCTCSNCLYGEEGEVLLSDKTPYCPVCGAEMENFRE